MLDDQKLQILLWSAWKQSYLEYSQFSDGKERNEELWNEQGETIREELMTKVRASIPYLKTGKEWMMADATIREMTVSPTKEKIDLWIEGVVDYDSEPYEELNLVPSPITVINVHLCLKGVESYRILWIEDGKIVEEDNQEKHLQEKMREDIEFIQWKIVNDYYEMYEDGKYHLLIFVPREDGVCIEILCQDMEVTSEVDKGQKKYLKMFMEWQKN